MPKSFLQKRQPKTQTPISEAPEPAVAASDSEPETEEPQVDEPAFRIPEPPGTPAPAVMMPSENADTVQFTLQASNSPASVTAADIETINAGLAGWGIDPVALGSRTNGHAGNGQAAARACIDDIASNFLAGMFGGTTVEPVFISSLANADAS